MFFVNVRLNHLNLRYGFLLSKLQPYYHYFYYPELNLKYSSLHSKLMLILGTLASVPAIFFAEFKDHDTLGRCEHLGYLLFGVKKDWEKKETNEAKIYKIYIVIIRHEAIPNFTKDKRLSRTSTNRTSTINIDSGIILWIGKCGAIRN